MNIAQVNSAFVRGNIQNPSLYRVSSCDDGKNGKQHISVRIKPVKNLTVEELGESLGNPEYGFILVTLDGIDDIV